jgi:hypothetical protein
MALTSQRDSATPHVGVTGRDAAPDFAAGGRPQAPGPPHHGSFGVSCTARNNSYADPPVSAAAVPDWAFVPAT